MRAKKISLVGKNTYCTSIRTPISIPSTHILNRIYPRACLKREHCGHDHWDLLAASLATDSVRESDLSD